MIGAGFAGMAAATNLAHKGYDVTVIEKNQMPGGRARHFCAQGFTFDMGPSWYWMPDVFDSYFKIFDKSPSDYYRLTRLDPSYRIYFGEGDYQDIPADFSRLVEWFDRQEQGAGEKLHKFINQAAYKYEVGIRRLVYKPCRSVKEFISPKLLYDMLRMDLFSSFTAHVKKYFVDERIRKLVEFPVLFLGATPQNTPALYSFMNYADMRLGTWYPEGGMKEVVGGLYSLAKEKGVKFKFGENVLGMELEAGQVKRVKTERRDYIVDVMVAGADYNHVEQKLLPARFRSYSERYWESRKLAPSALLFYLGINKKLSGLLHHNLFFHEDFTRHANEIYNEKKWPSQPLFYVCAPSKTDPGVAPEGAENLFILMPAAVGLEDTEEIRAKYFNLLITRLEKITGEEIRKHIVYSKSYAHNDFIHDYNAFKGNAYGLANTLRQTALLKPSLKSRKVRNLFYTGQLTVPGPGAPPCLISGIVVANEVEKEFKL